MERTRFRAALALSFGVALALSCGDAQENDFDSTDPMGGAQDRGGSGGASSGSAGKATGDGGMPDSGGATAAQGGSPEGGNGPAAGANSGGGGATPGGGAGGAGDSGSAGTDTGGGATGASGSGGASCGSNGAACDYDLGKGALKGLCEGDVCGPCTDGFDDGACHGAYGNTTDPYICAGGACVQGCSNDIQCDTGHCTDGVCCDEPSSTCNDCRACNVSGLEGTCSNVESGDDPHDFCALDLSSCSADTCNGQGSCKYDDDTPCENTTCSADQETRYTCQSGSCASSNHSCQGFGCGADYCNGSCTPGSETGCEANYFCLPSGDACAPQQGEGQSCDDDVECLSGNCVDDVCCDTAADECDGCFACNVQDFLGACTEVPAGDDPHQACTASLCNADECNGEGSCALPDDTGCGDPSCTGGQESSYACLDGLCLGTTSKCSPFACNTIDCYESCTVGSNVGCPTDYYCAAGTSCEPMKELGMSCSSANECKPGAYCTDGVCCQSASCSSCTACNVAAKEGSCSDVEAGDDLWNDCADDACHTGDCNGFGDCETDNDTGSCDDSTCSSGSQHDWLCKGGTCTEVTVSCENYTCGPSECAETCTQGTDAGCAPDAYCDENNDCQPLKAQGKDCESANECQAGLYCTDGTCCNVAVCSDHCEVCKNDLGICMFTPSGSDPQGDCADDDFCLSGACDGDGACETANEGQSCAASQCASDSQTDYACASGQCDSSSFLCGVYVCADASACSDSCTQGSNEGCAADAYCDVNDECQPLKAQGDDCEGAAECEDGLFCTDGVCCGVDACGTCEICEAGSGVCGFTLPGEDPHDDCTANLALCQLDDCNGDGACQAVVTGTTCGTNICEDSGCSGQCTDTTLTVYECDGVTSDSCPWTEVACADHLVCASGSACLGSCSNHADCLDGSFCDSDSKTCEDQLPNGSDCGEALECASHACHVGKCRQCDGVRDCPAIQAVCQGSGQCTGCLSDLDCQIARWGAECNVGSNFCYCTADDECNARGATCDDISSQCVCGSTGAACPLGQLCTTRTVAGVCKFGPGEPCQAGSDCVSGTCTSGACAKLQAGAPCDVSTQCAGNSCNGTTYVCN